MIIFVLNYGNPASVTSFSFFVVLYGFCLVIHWLTFPPFIFLFFSISGIVNRLLIYILSSVPLLVACPCQQLEPKSLLLKERTCYSSFSINNCWQQILLLLLSLSLYIWNSGFKYRVLKKCWPKFEEWIFHNKTRKKMMHVLFLFVRLDLNLFLFSFSRRQLLLRPVFLHVLSVSNVK